MSDKKSNVERLADILASTAGIKNDKEPKQVIKDAINVLKEKKASKKVAKEVEKDIKQAKIEECDDQCSQDQDCEETQLNEEELWGTDNKQALITQYLKAKFAGMPDVKSWGELQRLDRDNLCNTAEEEYDWVDVDDTDFDRENQITYADIDQYLNSISAADYLKTIYEPDELEFVDDEDETDDERREKEVFQAQCLLDQNYKACEKYSDQQLQEALDYAIDLSKKSSDPEVIIEALTQAQRLRRAAKMRAMASRIALKRKIALSRVASNSSLMARSRKLALRILKRRLSGGRKLEDLSYSERENLERKLKGMKPLIDRLERKLFPFVRSLQQKRLANKVKKSIAQGSKVGTPVQDKQTQEPENVKKTPVVQKVSNRSDKNAQDLSGAPKV